MTNMLREVLGDMLGPLLSGLEQADAVVSGALDKLGEGIEFTGEETEKLAALVASLGPKLEALKAKLAGGGGG